MLADEWHVGQVFWSLLWFTLFFIWIWLLIVVFADIFRSHDLGGFAKFLWVVFVISILVNVGMWFERFVIVVGGLYREFLPSNWGFYSPTWVDICTYIGTFGLFFTCFLLFMRFLPMIAISEVKGVTPQSDPHHPLAKTNGGKH